MLLLKQHFILVFTVCRSTCSPVYRMKSVIEQVVPASQKHILLWVTTRQPQILLQWNLWKLAVNNNKKTRCLFCHPDARQTTQKHVHLYMLITLKHKKVVEKFVKKSVYGEKNWFIEWTFVVGAPWNCLYEAIPMCTSKISYWNKNLFWNIHLSRIMSISFASLKHLNLPISIKIPVTIHWTEVISSHHTIFAPVQKVNIALTKFKFYKKVQGLSSLCKLWHFKMTGRPCTDKVRVKVP